MNFLSLPASVLCEVTRYVYFTDFVRLDSAFCHNHFRFIWLELLGSKEFTMCCIVNISIKDGLSWVLGKNLKCSQVKFTADMGALKDVADFLRMRGTSIRSVHFHGGTKQLEMVLIALNCRNLTKVCAVNVDLSGAFREILLRNSKIQKIWCSEVTFCEEDVFAGVSLHALHMLLVHGIDCPSGFPWHETARSDSLRMVALHECANFGPSLPAMLKNCPKLQTLSAAYCSDESDTLLVRSLGLKTISIYANDNITDGHILAMVNNDTSLRVLNIQNCAALTDLCLKHIAEHVGDRLEKLYVDIKYPESAETEAILKVLSQKCTNLKYLNIDCGNMCWHRNECTGVWLPETAKIGCEQSKYYQRFISGFRSKISF